MKTHENPFAYQLTSSMPHLRVAKSQGKVSKNGDASRAEQPGISPVVGFFAVVSFM